MTYTKADIDNLLSQMTFENGKPVSFRGYEVTSVAKCEKHGEWYAVRYGDDTTEWDIKLGCPKCAIEAIQAQALGEAAIPKRFLEKTIETFEVRSESQRVARQMVVEYIDTLDANLASGRCLIFSGNVGVGKTHLACAIANRAVRSGHSTFFASVSKLIRLVRASWGTREEQTVIDNLIDLDLLIIDEVGVQAGTENERNILFDIINGRYENMKSTLIITNLDRSQLPDYLGERIVDRLRENGGMLIPISGKSCRK